MSELLTNTLQDIYYDVFKNGVPVDADAAPSVSIFMDGVRVVDNVPSTQIAGETGKYSYTVPIASTVGTKTYELLASEGELHVEWKFSVGGVAITDNQYFEVVTPYSNWKYYYDQGNISYADYLECERVARYVINTYCGQSFGKKYTTYAIEGHGTDGLQLPWRLITLESVDWNTWDSTRPGPVIGVNTWPTWELAADGWVLRPQPQPHRMNPTMCFLPKFERNVLYNVTGVWGYTSVPGPVQEAAKILTADYLCQDHKYRDKYLESIKFGDWSLKFNQLAYKGTGNATVDELLTDYRNYPGVGLI